MLQVRQDKRKQGLQEVGQKNIHLQFGRESALSLLKMQQMCFTSSFCKGELQASESKVLQIHLFCKVFGLSSFKTLRQYSAEKIIPNRKNMSFYVKDSLLSESIFWGCYKFSLSQRSLNKQELFYQLQMTSVGMA